LLNAIAVFLSSVPRAEMEMLPSAISAAVGEVDTTVPTDRLLIRGPGKYDEIVVV
jgi:hypothetical protein